MDVIKSPELKNETDNEDLVSRLSELGMNVDEKLLSDPSVGEPLKNYLVLTYLPQLTVNQFSELESFYNRYFWLSTVTARYKEKFGHDNGFEQQVFKLLEEADTLDEPVDWELVEKLNVESSRN